MLSPDVKAGDPIPQSVDLRDLIVGLTHSNEVLVPDFVTSINLGTFGDEARGLFERSQSDLQNGILNERGRGVLVTKDKRVLVATHDVLSTPGENNLRISAGQLPASTLRDPNARNRKDMLTTHLATIIHSHPFALPPSAGDLGTILRNPLEPLSSTTLVYVVNELGHTLVFRGPQTPHLSKARVEKIVRETTEIIRASVLQNAPRDPTTGEINVSEVVRLEKAVQDTTLETMVEAFDLRVFTCPLDEHIAKRVMHE